MNRRQFVRAVGGMSLAVVTCGAGAQSASYPTKPVRIIVSSVAGALLDASARLYADRMSRYLKQSVVVENMPGASSMLGARYVARSAADGYTLLAFANTVVTMPHLVKGAGYDFDKDFVAVGEMARSPGLLVVGGTSPFKALGNLVSAAKSKPGEVTFGSAGQGSTSHMPVELFMKSADIHLTHIPYKGVAPVVPDVISGRVSCMMGTATSLYGSIQAGTLRALAISSESRSRKFPNVPTFKELGYPEGTYSIFVGLAAPAGVPKAVLARLADAMEVARSDQALQARLAALDQEVSEVRTPEKFQAFLLAEEKRTVQLIKEANIQPE
ncbi:Bug family tripartite tricarboxylate transporter substrate binding protein [Cupriavidus lacunae]|uniref:Tripartite tricarboxylate transporter substrate binding protein n=1 Tax=Cupriavidus lacunae TaxID=2666307 RepID=A0A370NLN3_9BURK|nr:tripartite tricarboxylate transporter substrate binding protein [Cupriavidus lacunae]RDK06517.1 tripartite tricarboxylate transporter substrate binding protein [Cupriavidus lacunae]